MMENSQRPGEGNNSKEVAVNPSQSSRIFRAAAGYSILNSTIKRAIIHRYFDHLGMLENNTSLPKSVN